MFLAPKVFRWEGTEVLEFDYEPSEELGPAVERARAACPVAAIMIDHTDQHPDRELA
ncbi:MAG: hypothetical protein ACREQM_17810 [Candidatus Dormibacteraceae bacterium]